MAKLNQGINGPISGKIGRVVGSSWKGIPYIKSAPGPRTKKAGAGEQANRNKFGEAQAWLRPLLELVRQGFKGYTPTVEGFVAAKSYLMRNAFEGDLLNQTINPALVKISHGDLSLAENITVEKNGGDQLLFSWGKPSGKNYNNYDQVMLLAYDIENARAEYIVTGQFRHVGSATLPLDNKKGKTYHIYFAFCADDRSRQSDSVYLGTIVF